MANHWPWVEGAPPMNPMVSSFPGCCARTTSGHATAAPPSSDMNWRLLIQSPRRSSSLLIEVLGWRYGGRGRDTIAALTGGGVPLINNDRPGRWIGSGGVRTQRIEACFLLVAKPVIEFRQRGLHG